MMFIKILIRIKSYFHLFCTSDCVIPVFFSSNKYPINRVLEHITKCNLVTYINKKKQVTDIHFVDRL